MSRISTSKSNHTSIHRLLLLSLVLIASAHSSFGKNAVLNEIRVGPHRDFDRLVFELNQSVDYSVNSETAGQLVVVLRSADVTDRFSLPKLPEKLECMRAIEIYRVGDSDLELEVALKNRYYYAAFVLPGSPWRLVIDISMRPIESPADAAKPKTGKEPEYVPGDRPIETRFAGTEIDSLEVGTTIEPDSEFILADEIADNSQDSVSESESIPELEAEPGLAVDETVEPDSDPDKMRAILREFYLVMGDTERANQFAGPIDEVYPLTESDSDNLKQAFIMLFMSMPWLIFAAAFVLGIGGGLVGLWIGGRLRRTGGEKQTSRFEDPPAELADEASIPAEEPAADPVEELEQDIDTLDEAVQAEEEERPEDPDLQPLPEVYAEAGAKEEPVPDEEIKETAMERRVNRVLELSKQGEDLASIAKQLEMSQDEVKLILDLN